MVSKQQIENLNLILKAIFSKPKATILGDLADEIPTQKDKPSAGSSLSYGQAVRLANLVATQHGNSRVSRVANTNSMEPWIDANTIVVMEKITANRLNIQPITAGDIVSYSGDGSIHKNFHGKNILHRVHKVSVDGNYFYFKGDNNFVADGWIHKKWLNYRLFAMIQFRKTDFSD